MIKKNFMKKALVFTAAFLTTVVTLGVKSTVTYALEMETKTVNVTGTSNFKAYGETKEDARIDIQEGDIWIGDFAKETTGTSVSASKIKELILDEDEDNRIMDVRLSNTFSLSIFDILEDDDDEDEEESDGMGSGDTEVVELGIKFKDAEGIINKGGNINVMSNEAPIETVHYGPGEKIVLDVKNADAISTEGYYWFKLDTSMEYYGSYVDGVSEAYIFTYHTVKNLEKKGTGTYVVDRKDYIGFEDGGINGLYGCATIKNGKPYQLVCMYNLIAESDLSVSVPEKITVGLGEKVEIIPTIKSSYKDAMYYAWTNSYGEVLGEEETFTIDKVMNQDMGVYYLMVYDGIKLKTVSFELVADTTKLPTVGTATGVKTAARGTYSIKLSWNKATNATGYVVYKAVSGKWVRVGQTAGTSIVISKLNAGTNCAFAVKPYRNHYGKIVYASKHTSVSSFTKPAPVKAFTTPKRAYTAVTAKWTKVAGATGYVVYKKVGTKWVKLGTTKTNSYTYKGLKRNTAYSIAVRPYKISGGVVAYADKSTYGTIRTLK